MGAFILLNFIFESKEIVFLVFLTKENSKKTIEGYQPSRMITI